MEEGLTSPPDSRTETPHTQEYWLDALCVYYMGCGISPEEFWHGDYRYFHFYEAAEKARQKRQNFQAWLQGAYNYHALLGTVGNMFREKGSTPHKYPEEPFTFDSEDDEDKALKEQRARDEAFKAQFKLFAARMEANQLTKKIMEKDNGRDGDDGDDQKSTY